MWRSLAISFLSFPFSVIGFLAGWAFADLRTGLLAGGAVFGIFLLAAVISLFFIKTYSYGDAALPPLFSVFWSLAMAPFSFGASLFSAPAFIGSGALLGACMALAKRYRTGLRWLVLPAMVFIYEMLPVNIPGPVDDAFALGGAATAVAVQFIKLALPAILRELAGRAGAGRGGKR